MKNQKIHNIITEKIFDLIINKYKENPYDINNGDCDRFASDLFIYLEQNNIKVSWQTTDRHQTLPQEVGHDWISYEDIHYDAETPYGVPNPFELPIFKKYLYFK